MTFCATISRPLPRTKSRNILRLVVRVFSTVEGMKNGIFCFRTWILEFSHAHQQKLSVYQVGLNLEMTQDDYNNFFVCSWKLTLLWVLGFIIRYFVLLPMRLERVLDLGGVFLTFCLCLGLSFVL